MWEEKSTFSVRNRRETPSERREASISTTEDDAATLIRHASQ